MEGVYLSRVEQRESSESNASVFSLRFLFLDSERTLEYFKVCFI